MKIIRILFIILFLGINSFINANSIENKILLKIDNEIITTIDVFKETNYLKAINSKINEMQKEDIYNISINSLIKQKIKKIEVQKNISNNNFDYDEAYLNELVKNTYKKKGFKNIEDFNKHLKLYEVDMTDIKDRISLESLWNELIYKKFSKKVIIDKAKLREKIIEDNDRQIKSFLISEIVFKILENKNINETFELIQKDIDEKGFSNSALLHSISNSAINGGDLGWIVERSLNPKIKDKINKLKVGSYTDPITIPGGFLILKLNEVKKDKIKYDIDKKLNELIRITTNQQLNQLSNIYFDKIKKEIKIEKL